MGNDGRGEPRRVEVGCQGEVHWLLIDPDSGEIDLADHNLRAERAAYALSGKDPCTCYTVYRLVGVLWDNWLPHSLVTYRAGDYVVCGEWVGRTVYDAIWKITAGAPFHFRWRWMKGWGEYRWM